MDLGLKGRTAIVCGASSGMGLAVAETLAAEGANVAMLGRRRDVLEREAERIGALAVRGDVTVPADLERLVARTLEAFGGVDILVLNSGGPPPGPATSLDDERAEAAFELLLLSVIRLTRLCLPHLRRSKAGRIVAITSSAVKEPLTSLALSSTMRPGVVGYLKTLATELGPDGITVNCVAPGSIDTARLAQLYPGGPSEEQLESIPLRRWGQPSEFADVVCFLVSDRASYVSGTTIAVDGGSARSLF
jgi:3-oxoacyl-[acyl-carrier protein] reductase